MACPIHTISYGFCSTSTTMQGNKPLVVTWCLALHDLWATETHIVGVEGLSYVGLAVQHAGLSMAMTVEQAGGSVAGRMRRAGRGAGGQDTHMASDALAFLA